MEGTAHPDRDGQFRHIDEQARSFMATGDPVISVDAEGAGELRGVQERGHRVAGQRRADQGQDPRLPGQEARQGGPLRDLRPGEQQRLGAVR
ncbi:ISAzo13-like element transposase-related protein [Actinospica durhamensis]|uniref:ISAzo13-like element transposase-related protein n=1 Tax=Actinospica durhamensis TaxID=1508375 RepID=UPI0034D6EDFA